MLQRLLVNLEWSWILCFRVFVVVRAWFLPRCQSGAILTLCLKVVFPESSSTFSLTQFCSCETFWESDALSAAWNVGWLHFGTCGLIASQRDTWIWLIVLNVKMFHLVISMRWLLRWPGTLCRPAMKLPTCVEAVGSCLIFTSKSVVCQEPSALSWTIRQCSLAESAIQIDKFLFVGLERVILEL